jgi:hypothetical protein
MITIKVVFVQQPLSEQEASRLRNYTFAVETVAGMELHVGDCLQTERYSSLLQVREVINEQYEYYSPVTGELSREARPGYLQLKLLKVH